MKMRRSILGLLAFAAIMVVAGAAYASCTGGNRVSFHQAECLHGWWDNNPWPAKSTFAVRVKNDCHLWGTVVAKIDLASCSDKTWHLNDTNRRRGSEACRVNGIYCCKDVGDLCNRSDLVTIAGCTSQWNSSPASDTCDLSDGSTSSVTADTDDHTCDFWADCQYTADDGTTQEKATSIGDVHWLNADNVINCDGELKKSYNDCASSTDVEPNWRP